MFCDSGHATAWKAFHEADVVIAVGNSLDQHATFDYRDDLFDNRTLIHINISEMEIDKVYKADYAMVSDAKRALVALIDALEKKSGRGRRRRSTIATTRRACCCRGPAAFTPARWCRRSDGCCRRAASCSATPAPTLPGWPTTSSSPRARTSASPARLDRWPGHVNGAIGVKCAHPDRTVVVGCGDGCYSLSGFELMTAVEHSLPVIWIIFDDGEFKLIKLYQLSAYLETGLVEFKNPDFAAYARACGADGYRVGDPGRVRERLRSGARLEAADVIDAKITRLALPHYSPSPEGTIAGILEMVEARFRGGRNI